MYEKILPAVGRGTWEDVCGRGQGASRCSLPNNWRDSAGRGIGDMEGTTSGNR
jgi:hypothetical protein